MRDRTMVLATAGLMLVWVSSGYPADLQRIPANPAKGFSWAYYLMIPDSINQPPVLFVEPNNTGRPNSDPAYHDSAAQSLIQSKTSWASDLGTPYLVPTFPRPFSDSVAYTHALDRNTILTTAPGLERIDLQLIAMIRDAQERLAERGIEVDRKVFMAGASASGSFTSRFVMLHPDVIKAASIGCPGFGPIVPVAAWNGQSLPYPQGAVDFEQLIGKPFDRANFQKVPLQVWVGDEDYNVDPWWNPSDPEIALIIAAFGGRHLYQRWPVYEAAYSSVSSLCQFVVFPTMGHAWANWSYMREFFERYRNAIPPSPLPKPELYTVYFPHVASLDPWETEIALTNTSVAAVRGELKAYGPDGGGATQSVNVTLGPLQRKEITVGRFFQDPANIAYLSFASDSGFLAGYTRFYQPGNRVSLPAGTGARVGWFPKMEQDGWTGIAFVNVETTSATVTLTATDANGNEVSSATLTLTPGKKYVGMVNQLFSGNLSAARYFKYVSDKRILGFTVSGSSDGQMLDGLPCLGQYVYQ
jgi:hypothetical protein